MKREKTFDVNYYNTSKSTGEKIWTHKYTEKWESLDLFCPNCGKKDVWHSAEEGDYYMGELYLCTNCDYRFYLPSGVNPVTGDDSDEQRLSAIKS